MRLVATKGRSTADGPTGGCCRPQSGPIASWAPRGPAGVDPLAAPGLSCEHAAVAYPSPEVALERFLAALEALANDETQPAEKRSGAQRALTGLRAMVADVGSGAVGNALGTGLATAAVWMG